MAEAWRCADEIGEDTTGDELAHALPEDATVCVLGWPELAGEALVRRGDVYGLVVDTLGEGSGLVRRLRRADVVAEEVPPSGLGAAAAAADVVLLEATAIGPDGFVLDRRGASRRRGGPPRRCAGVAVGGVGPRPARADVAGAGEAARRRVRRPVGSRRTRCVPLALVDRLCGPKGPEPVADGLRHADTPVAPELLPHHRVLNLAASAPS